MKLYLCGILPLLVCGCATTKSADTYPSTWVQSSALMPAVPEDAAAIGALASATVLPTAPSESMYSYVPPQQCYVIIEDKTIVSEICQRDTMIVYNPAATGIMSSIIPSEIAGVLVLQGHLMAPGANIPAAPQSAQAETILGV